ncbi:MAG: type I methionyl aminopeptidase [Candidatus Marinimicrobia bacterium]|nr:type I methionyl aminopeptidase [Candidatus Neomarinimicrobiota bacterium]
MIYIRSEDEIEKIAESNKINYEALMMLKDYIEPGISTKKLDGIAEDYIRSRGAEPAFKGYKGFPATLCTSINNEIVHGIPSEERVLVDGDLISIDVGVKKDSYYGDAAYTFTVGDVDKNVKKLLEVTQNSLYRGIEQAIEGNNLSDIGSEIQKYVESNGFSVVRDLVGHGIGRKLHEEPEVPNFGKAGKGPRLKKGMCLAIEPMVNAGDFRIKTLDDKWTVVTMDGTLSAHFEHTIAITDNGPLILADKKIEVN